MVKYHGIVAGGKAFSKVELKAKLKQRRCRILQSIAVLISYKTAINALLRHEKPFRVKF